MPYKPEMTSFSLSTLKHACETRNVSAHNQRLTMSLENSRAQTNKVTNCVIKMGYHWMNISLPCNFWIMKQIEETSH